MRRCLLILIWLLAAGQLVFAQGPLIYVRPDYSMDLEQLRMQLRKVIESSGDSYVIYYSGIKSFSMTSDNYDEDKLFGAISTQNSRLPVVPLQEIEALSALLESNLDLTVDPGGMVRSAKGYGSIEIICFVGDDFIEGHNADAVIARLLVVNGLSGDGTILAEVSFYPCGAAYAETPIKFSDKYGITKEIVVEK
ncbi:MAG: hypothetical protein IJU19_05355 [Bacteroidales bacterium]|nr:hypothetical protein [Bacteroidales bacterium]